MRGSFYGYLFCVINEEDYIIILKQKSNVACIREINSNSLKN